MIRNQILRVFLLCIIACNPASAARFPDAVDRKIVLTGGATALIAELFGLDTSQRSASLQLGRGDAWAVYLLKQDTKIKLSNDNEGSPPRFNTIEYLDSKRPSLTIFPYWLDQGTQHPNSRAGYYRFSSPFLPEAVDRKDAWNRLVLRLKKESQWNAGATTTQYHRCFSCHDGKELCIDVYDSDDHTIGTKGHTVSVTVGPVGNN